MGRRLPTWSNVSGTRLYFTEVSTLRGMNQPPECPHRCGRSVSQVTEHRDRKGALDSFDFRCPCGAHGFIMLD